MDWATRRVLSWRLSNTLDAGFCVEALAEALDCYGRPEIFNTDQGSQFTSFEFTALLKNAGVAISMDGRGRCMDNIFIERLWRSLKYEAVHSALAGATPAEAYEKALPPQSQHKHHRLSAPLPAQPQHKVMINRTLAA